MDLIDNFKAGGSEMIYIRHNNVIARNATIENAVIIGSSNTYINAKMENVNFWNSQHDSFIGCALAISIKSEDIIRAALTIGCEIEKMELLTEIYAIEF